MDNDARHFDSARPAWEEQLRAKVAAAEEHFASKLTVLKEEDLVEEIRRAQSELGPAFDGSVAARIIEKRKIEADRSNRDALTDIQEKLLGGGPR